MMMKFVFNILAAGVMTLLLANVLFAQPNLSGNLSGNLGPGSYVVVGNCTVPAGQSLTIQPGTTLLFSGHYTFFVYGQLTAMGTAADSIRFLPQNPGDAYRHGGLRFQPATPQNYMLAYCRIDNARNQTFPIYTGGAIYVQNANLILSHSLITNSISNTGGGLYSSGGTLTVSACVFVADSANDGAGIYATNGSTAVTGSEFYDNKCFNSGNGGGIFLYYSNPALVDHCIFYRNHSDGT
jgi:hypothetical protein